MSALRFAEILQIWCRVKSNFGKFLSSDLLWEFCQLNNFTGKTKQRGTLHWERFQHKILFGSVYITTRLLFSDFALAANLLLHAVESVDPSCSRSVVEETWPTFPWSTLYEQKLTRAGEPSQWVIDSARLRSAQKSAYEYFVIWAN